MTSLITRLREAKEFGWLTPGLRCIDGRMFRHDPFPDDPDFEIEVGQCPTANEDGRCHLCSDDVPSPKPMVAHDASEKEEPF